MKKVYFISGLGADKRAFGFLNLSFCNPHFITWPVAERTDTLQSYSEKVFQKIHDENGIIIGLSFGGMLATEIAKRHPGTKVIIISSCKTFHEIPGYLRFWRYLPIYKLYSNRFKKLSAFLPSKVLGVKGDEQKNVQRQILSDSNPSFTRWAIDAILKWKNDEVPKNLTHIHGTDDNLLPYKYVKPNYTIVGGTHLMIMDRGKELSELLQKLIND